MDGRAAPNTLQRNGISAVDQVGTVIVVSGYKAKDGRMRANSHDITFLDGRTLFMGCRNRRRATARILTKNQAEGALVVGCDSVLC